MFDDGVQHEDVPVLSYDYLADLAFLGPINTSASPLKIANAEDEKEGGTVFVIGYPENTLRLSIAKGVFEHIYNWEDADVAEVFSTAEGGRGMSGGPIVNGIGEVIGVHLWSYDKGGSGGTSSNVVRSRLEGVIRGEEASPAGSRPLPTDQGSYYHEFVLRGRADTETFFFRDLSETSISIEFDTAQEVEYGLFAELGFAYFRPAFRSTRNGMVNSCCYSGIWFVVVRQRFDLEREGVIKSSVPLVRYHDPDDGRRLKIGDTITAVFDTAGDIDRYTIDLETGQRIGVRFNHTYGVQMTIERPDAAPYEVFSVEGRNEEVEFKAPVGARYTIALKPSGGMKGYTLSAIDIPSNSKPSNKPKKPADTIESPVGDMLRHTFQHSSPAIQIKYPLNITGGDHAEILGAALFEQGLRGQTVALGKRDMKLLRRRPNEDIPPDLFALRSILIRSLPLLSEQVTGSREILTPWGAPILIEYFKADQGDTKGVRLAYIHEGETGFMVVFYAPADVFDEWKPVVDYCIGSFSIGDFSVADGM